MRRKLVIGLVGFLLVLASGPSWGSIHPSRVARPAFSVPDNPPDIGLKNWFPAAIYGAKGNGTTDDTAKIQAAVNAAQAAGRGVVVIPHGTYKLTAAILITSPSIVIRGDGAGDAGTVLRQDTYGQPCIEIRSGSGSEVLDLECLSTQTKTVISPSYDGKPARDHAAGVYIANSNRVRVDNLAVKGMVVGVKLRGDTSDLTAVNTGNWVTNLYCETFDYGVLSEQQGEYIYSHCRFINTENSQPTAPPHSIYLTGPISFPFSRSRNGVISDCTTRGNIYASPWKFKFTDCLSASDLSSDGTERIADIEDCDSSAFTNIVGWNMTAPYNGDTQMAGFSLSDCDRSTFTGLRASVVGQDNLPGFLLRYTNTGQYTTQATATYANQSSGPLIAGNVTVTNPGGGYTVQPIVTVTGDGTGAVAVATWDQVTHTVTGITFTAGGSGYTNATLTISGGIQGTDNLLVGCAVTANYSASNTTSGIKLSGMTRTVIRSYTFNNTTGDTSQFAVSVTYNTAMSQPCVDCIIDNPVVIGSSRAVSIEQSGATNKSTGTRIYLNRDMLIGGVTGSTVSNFGTSTRVAFTADNQVTLTANSTAPSVVLGNLFITANSSPTTYTNLANGFQGQVITIIGADTNSHFVTGTNFQLSANWDSTVTATLTLVYDGSKWHEVSRSS